MSEDRTARMEDLLEIMRRLRDPDGGCPWDRDQDFRSIAPYTIEEAYEVADAIARGEIGALRDELGDLLFQVVFHARMAEEAGRFDFHAVVAAIIDKLVRRHPHVFGDVVIDDATAQSAAWERHKREERAGGGALDGVPVALPALARAQKLQRRAAGVGFDWPDRPPVMAKLREEIDELDAEIESGDREACREEIGDLMFSVVNLARHLDIDAESALREASSKFQQRFEAVEARLAGLGVAPEDAGLELLDRLWDEVKQAG